MPCAYCTAQFTLITWKIKCVTCSKNFCSKCISQSNCKSCHGVHSTNLKRAQLIKLKVKDLKLYLLNRNQAIGQCREKQELVKMIQSLNGIQEQDLENHTESYSNSHYSDTENNHNNIDTDEMDWAFTPSPPSYSATQTSFPTAQEFSTTTTQQTTTTTINNDGSTTQFTSTSTKGPSHSKNQTIKLNDIQSGDDIKTFSIKQLKGLLKDNLVDSIGILEKEELINKVLNLYQDNLKNQDLIEESGSGETAGFSGAPSYHSTKHDENFCKICWDDPVDCVFLECGHMVTCIECSKQVKECPICRQNIVRKVRVFKS